MKASELAEILRRTPDAIVMHEEYCGGDTPCLEIHNAIFVEKGQTFVNEGGEHIERGVTRYNGKATCDVIVLYSC